MPTPTIKKATPKPDVQIYHFDPQTNEACGSDIADLDPLENKPLLPAFATLIAPPATIAAGKVAVFDEAAGKWSQVENHRGKVYDTATGNESLYDKLGVLPATLTTTAPTANSTWDAVKKAWVIDAVKAAAALIATHNAPILAKIHALESAQTSRLLREVSLGNVASKQKLAKMDVAIAKLRATLKK